jgi:hypothetical protein
MEFLAMLLAGFHWEINPMAGHAISRISSNTTSWISLGNIFHS